MGGPSPSEEVLLAEPHARQWPATKPSHLDSGPMGCHRGQRRAQTGVFRPWQVNLLRETSFDGYERKTYGTKLFTKIADSVWAMSLNKINPWQSSTKFDVRPTGGFLRALYWRSPPRVGAISEANITEPIPGSHYPIDQNKTSRPSQNHASRRGKTGTNIVRYNIPVASSQCITTFSIPLPFPNEPLIFSRARYDKTRLYNK